MTICLFSLQLSPSFTPTSVIKKMYESKEKNKDEPVSRPGSKEDTANSQEGKVFNLAVQFIMVKLFVYKPLNFLPYRQSFPQLLS